MLALALAALLPAASATEARQPTDTQIDRQLVSQLTATISSRAALDAYLAKEPLQSPLLQLSAENRRSFINSLVFGANGLGSYDYQPLLKADFLDAYKILRLFGSEQSLAVVVEKFRPSASRAGRQVALLLKHDAGLSEMNRVDSECWKGACRGRLGHICVAGGC